MLVKGVSDNDQFHVHQVLWVVEKKKPEFVVNAILMSFQLVDTQQLHHFLFQMLHVYIH